MSTIQKLEDLARREESVELYLVGGAVRDQIMGRNPKDEDFVITGVGPEDMEEMGFKQVGQGFPVFLTREGDEVALPRTEQSTGGGFSDFDVSTSPDMSIEKDLERRDLTINAMARNVRTGRLIDPFGGQRDLQAGIIRHVSEAFLEDPVRVLRVARFATRFGFEVADETKELARKGARNLPEVPGERIEKDTTKAFKQSDAPGEYVQTLFDVGALFIAFPEFKELSDGEIQNTIDVINEIKDRDGSPEMLYAGLGYKLTADAKLDLINRLNLSNDIKTLMKKTNLWTEAKNFDALDPEDQLDFLQNFNIEQKKEVLLQSLGVFQSIADVEDGSTVDDDLIVDAAKQAASVGGDELGDVSDLSGEEIADKVRSIKLDRLKNLDESLTDINSKIWDTKKKLQSY